MGSLTAGDIVAIVQTLVMIGAGIFVWRIGLERSAVDKMIANLRAERERETAEMNRLFDIRLRQLQGQIDKIPTMEQLRRVFATRERVDELAARSHDEHSEIWVEVNRIKERKP